jgi:hypothetical protein
VSRREKMPSGMVELFSPSMVRMHSAMPRYGGDIYIYDGSSEHSNGRRLFLLEMLIGVRFAPDTTPCTRNQRYTQQKNSTTIHMNHTTVSA